MDVCGFREGFKDDEINELLRLDSSREQFLASGGIDVLY